MVLSHSSVWTPNFSFKINQHLEVTNPMFDVPHRDNVAKTAALFCFVSVDTREDANSCTLDPWKPPSGTSDTTSGTSIYPSGSCVFRTPLLVGDRDAREREREFFMTCLKLQSSPLEHFPFASHKSPSTCLLSALTSLPLPLLFGRYPPCHSLFVSSLKFSVPHFLIQELVLPCFSIFEGMGESPSALCPSQNCLGLL